MKIAIIGGGAAGMMAAAVIAEQSDHEVHVLEKNSRLGAKVLISGGGRCNVTTGYIKKQELQKKYFRGRDFLQHSMGQFGPRKMRQWVEAHGVPLKCEDDMRVFPQSDKGEDVVGVFEHIFREKNVTIHFKEGADSISYNQGVRHVKSSLGKEYEFDKVVIATGGNAYAHTGSSGDGYDLAKQCGHTITPLGPSLNSFLVEEERVKTLSGISFSNALVKVGSVAVQGPMLLTHFGISGPAVFAFSSQTAFETVSKGEPLKITCAPFADINEEKRMSILTEYAHTQPKKQIDTILNYHFPDRFVQALLSQVQIINTRNIADLTRDEKTMLAKTLGGGIPLTLIARRAGDEFVTAGGVSTDEINNKTMESTICPGLYFVGEVLNVDGVTGGYNLQACRSTAYAAAIAIAQSI